MCQDIVPTYADNSGCDENGVIGLIKGRLDSGLFTGSLFPYLLNDISGDYFLVCSDFFYAPNDFPSIAMNIYGAGQSPCSWSACIPNVSKARLAIYIDDYANDPLVNHPEYNCCLDAGAPTFDVDLHINVSIYPVTYGGKTYLRYDLYAFITAHGCDDCIVGIVLDHARDIKISDSPNDADAARICFTSNITDFVATGLEGQNPAPYSCGPIVAACDGNYPPWFPRWCYDGCAGVGDAIPTFTAWVTQPAATTVTLSTASFRDAGNPQTSCPAPRCPEDCEGCCKTITFKAADCRGIVTHTFIRGNGIPEASIHACGYIKTTADSMGYSGSIGFDSIRCVNGVWKVFLAVPCDDPDDPDGGICQIVWTPGGDVDYDNCFHFCPPMGEAWLVDTTLTTCANHSGSFNYADDATTICEDDEEDI